MGYDMQLVDSVEDPIEVASTRDAFERAVAARNTLEKDDPRRAAAQKLVEQAAEDMYVANRDYHRKNVWGMGSIRRIMHQLGACWAGDGPEWPEEADYGLEAWPNPDDPELTDEARKFLAAVEAVKGFVGDQPGIPLTKFSSNDGWLVRPGECRSALVLIRKHDVEDVRTVVLDVLREAGDSGTDENLLAWWAQWVDWLELASLHGGFRVW
jgi:hypothetical protein